MQAVPARIQSNKTLYSRRETVGNTERRTTESCTLSRVRTIREGAIILSRPDRTKGDTFIQCFIKLWSGRSKTNVTAPVNGFYVLFSPLFKPLFLSSRHIHTVKLHGTKPVLKECVCIGTYLKPVPDIYVILCLRENSVKLGRNSRSTRHIPFYYLTCWLSNLDHELNTVLHLSSLIRDLNIRNFLSQYLKGTFLFFTPR
jgi:hypothetical protein